MPNSLKHHPTVHTYIFDNMQDGVMLLNARGGIDYFNPCAGSILGLSPSKDGSPFLVQSILQDKQDNDLFNQFILDAVYDKEHIHKGTVPYHGADGSKKLLQVRTSFWSDPEDETHCGVLLLFTDVTRTQLLRQQRNDAATTLSMLTSIICAWVIFVKGMEYFRIDLPSYLLTYVLIFIGAGALIIIRTKTSLSLGDMGLSLHNVRPALITDTLITVVLIVLMAAVKWVMVRMGTNFFPEGQPFWYFRVTSLGMLLYPISVVGQEFVSRGVLHECLRKVLQGMHREFYAILLSSLMFSALHLERGFPFMLGAALLLSVLGVVYLRQRTIWGLCIPHYGLTMAAIFLGFL